MHVLETGGDNVPVGKDDLHASDLGLDTSVLIRTHPDPSRVDPAPYGGCRSAAGIGTDWLHRVAQTPFNPPKFAVIIATYCKFWITLLGYVRVWTVAPGQPERRTARNHA